MRVLALSLIEVTYWATTALSFVLSWFSNVWIGLAYIHSLLAFGLLYLCVVRTPLALSWSWGLYGSVFYRIIVFQVLAILSYSLCYERSAALGDQFDSFWDAVYFSTTTWTTLGYGDISPQGNVKILTSLQALTGLASFPVLASIIWAYCENTVSTDSQDDKFRVEYGLIVDIGLGILKEEESQKTHVQQRERDKIKLKECGCGNARPSLIKIYEMNPHGIPYPKYLVTCDSCGLNTKPVNNAYLAAWSWNKNTGDII